MLKRICLLLLLLAVGLTACAQRTPPSSPPMESTPVESESASAPEPVQLDGEFLTRVGEKAQSIITNLTEVRFVGTEQVEGESWYLFDLEADVDMRVLVSPDLSRVYQKMATDPNQVFPYAANAYYPVEEGPSPWASSQAEQEFMDAFFARARENYGADETGGWGSLVVLDGRLCMTMDYSHIKDMETTYLTTYALSLDGQHFYRMNEEKMELELVQQS